MFNPQLETFINVAQSGSFSKAAELLFITPTAVMKQINALEYRIGFALFDRTNHGLILTKAGESFLQDAKYIVDYSAVAIKKAKEMGDRENQKPICIGTSIMTPAKFLMDIWSQIQEKNSNLQIELIPFENTPENAREILRNLGKHIDVVAGIYDDEFLVDRQCQAKYLYDKKISLAVPLEHQLASKSKIKLADLKGQKILLIKKGWNKYIDSMRKALTLQDVDVVDFDFFSINAFNIAVKENIPIMTIDGWENVHPLLKIIQVEWDFAVPFGIMYSKEPSKQVESFIETIAQLTL